MTRKTLRLVIIVAVFVVAVSAVGWWLVTKESPEEQQFKRVVEGMTVEEVEAILGPGEVIPQSEVMSYRVAVDPGEVKAFLERHRKAGTVPTAREYETRNKYVVEGDLIYHWQSGGFAIWVAFRDGKVCDKYLENWNYL